MAPEKAIEALEQSQEPIAQQDAAQSFDQQPGTMQPSRFPKFMCLPAELQQKIFVDAVNEPSLHVVKAHRKEEEGQQKWCLSFNPVAKSQDKSGYRLVKDIRAVSLAAKEAIRVFEQIVERDGDLSRLPFKALDAHVDAANDLVLIDIPGRKRFGTFHPDYQFLNPTFSTFDDAHLAGAFPTVQKVALNWRDRDIACHAFSVNFRCTEDPTLQGSSHATHFNWKLCPEEVCGLLNCFPKLREFYLIYRPSHSWDEKRMVETYAKNFHTLPSTSPLKRSLARFTGSDRTYIELHPALTKELSPDHSRFEPFRLGWQGAMARALAELKDRYFLRDTDPKLAPLVREQLGAMFRLSLEERKKLVCKVLLPVSDEMGKKAWEGEERRAVLRFLRGV